MQPKRVAREEQFSFDVWQRSVDVMTAGHTHSDIEINRVEQGTVIYFAAGRFQEFHAGDTLVFWAGMPHELMRVSPDAEMTWCVLPLAWFLQWQLDAAFVARLMDGEWMRAPQANSNFEAALFARWACEMAASPDEHTKKIVSLELEAWLRRVARAMPCEELRSHAGAAIGSDATARQIEAMARCVARRYREALSIGEIAAAANLHPHYAMTVWKSNCGTTLNEYLTRLRLSHAQRLLLTTDWKMGRIAEESGFGSQARFYAAFGKHFSTTPRAWKTQGVRPDSTVL
ncbi:MAG TPA: helix-turn-helix domain-containing protein [Abditibacteriaceae bacterium]|jgi:AraC-like DNA-binding protein